MKGVRHIQLKFWPEIMGLMPAIVAFERNNTDKQNPLDLDFSAVKEIYASSLALAAIDLLKVINETQNRKWFAVSPLHKPAAERLKYLGLIPILQSNIPQMVLWDSNLGAVSKRIETILIDGRRLISIPLFEIKFKGQQNKRALVETLRQDISNELDFLLELGFKVHKFISIITEMAKNSADHTDSNAYLGIDILLSGSSLQLYFAFGDLGIGINRNVRNMMENEMKKSSRASHLGLVETYHFALTPGGSTKVESRLNRGIGMSIIVEMAKDLEMNLSVFDAESRGILSEVDTISHAELRRIFFHLGKGRNVGFYYYGHLAQKTVKK